MALNITIIGLNALSGSLGLALGTLDQERLPGGRPIITGWDDDKRTLRAARGRLLIDREARDIADAVREADVILVCVPAAQIAVTFNTIGPHLKHGAVVSDVGRVKTHVGELARQYLPTTVDFIGGHPLVSFAEPGITGAKHDVFKNAIYCLLPAPQARPDALDTLAYLVQAIGAKPYYIDAAEHDAYIAAVDQMPLLLSAVLMDAISRSNGWREMQPLAGEALRSVTQLTAADAATSARDLHHNRTALERWINDIIRTLVDVRDNLDQPTQLEGMFEHARDAYEAWLTTRPNMRPGENEFYGESTDDVNRGLGALFFGQRRKKGGK